ncbi:MAG: gamma-glutamyltransferase [Limisphaerales bacterium]
MRMISDEQPESSLDEGWLRHEGSGKSPVAIGLAGRCLVSSLLFFSCLFQVSYRLEAGVAATVHPLATRAALRAMQAGGNAVDAAVAAGLTLGVVDGFNSGIGGGCFLLVRSPRGEIMGIDGRETAPAAATRDMFLVEGVAVPEKSQSGPLAVGVPGALAAFDLALKRYGKLSLEQVILPAAELAEEGFVVNASYQRRVQGVVDALKAFPEASRLFLEAGDKAPAVGHRLIQVDLANTYRAIARDGIDYFYRGDLAHQVDHWMRDHGGVLRATDLEDYRAQLRPPIHSTYRAFQVVGFPPPSSGGVHVAQILNILDAFPLGSMDHSSADWVHLVVEAMKLAFADRAHWLGDSDYVPVPSGLVSVDYARALAASIDPKRPSKVSGHGQPPHAMKATFGSHTTHFSTADEAGWWVACTATVNTTFGSKVVVPQTGVVLNNEMDDFSAQPGRPNFFGLVGSDANAVAPGKRPLSSMSPTIVLKDGEPIYSLGAAGGPTIISQTVLHLVLMIDFGMDPQQAMAHPRLHHQWQPDRLIMEEGWPDSVVMGLRRLGHEVEVVPSLGVSQAVAKDKGGAFVGASDPRVEGSAQVE